MLTVMFEGVGKMQTPIPDGRLIFSSVPKGKVWFIIFFQLLFASYFLAIAYEFSIDDVVFLCEKIVTFLLSVIWIFAFTKTYPFLIKGSMRLEVDKMGIIVCKYGKTWTIPWGNIKKIEFRPAVITIFWANWAYISIIYIDNGKSKTVRVLDAFSIDPKEIQKILLEKQHNSGSIKE